MANRTSSFLENASLSDLTSILETQCKSSETDEKECIISKLAHNGNGYCQATIPADMVKRVFRDGDPSAGTQLKISLHQIAAHVQSGARPGGNEAHHACRNRKCFRWTPDSLGRKHIEWVPEEIHKTIMCPINLNISVKCNLCAEAMQINVCTDQITPPHLGPSCF